LKVGFVLRSLAAGGAERQAALLGRGLFQMRKRGRWHLVGFLLRLVLELRRQRCDLIYTFLPTQNVLLAMLRPLLGRAVLVWGLRSSGVVPGLDLGHRTVLQLQTWLARCPALILANSDASVAFHLKKGFPVGRLAVVSNGIDERVFRPDQEARNRVRAALGLPPGTPLVGIVGRLEPAKGQEVFLSAASQVRSSKHVNIRLVIAGRGSLGERRRLMALASALHIADSVHWLDVTVRPQELYNALDVLVSASYAEGFPNVIAEAMACGTPCVATDVGDTWRIVDGFGIVVAPGDYHAMAAGIVQILAMPEGGSCGCGARIARRCGFR
jgi:glycosyltransferase involved in cell wall biosynthesis